MKQMLSVRQILPVTFSLQPLVPLFLTSTVSVTVDIFGKNKAMIIVKGKGENRDFRSQMDSPYSVLQRLRTVLQFIPKNRIHPTF